MVKIQIIDKDHIYYYNDNSIKCKRCGRKLNSNTSKAIGFGPECYKKYIKEIDLKSRLF